VNIKAFIAEIIRRLLPRAIMNEIRQMPEHANLSFSQEGEDILLQRLFENKATGFFIDVGAHHPTRFSNTYLFYLRGWRGINIDAMPGSMQAFDRLRPNDINIECAISDREEELTYFVFNKTALNTFSEEEALRKDGLRNYRIVERRIMKAHTLARLLGEHMQDGQVIDFLSVDAEGMDLRVLKSLDWSKHKPHMILAEDLQGAAGDEGEMKTYLQERGYELFARTLNTLFFRSKAR